jgi:hypothetical protein
MTRRLLEIAFFVAIFFVGPTKPLSDSSVTPLSAAPLIREEQNIVVDGVSELWRLEWKSPPKPACSAAENYMAITCPCSGFAYGESGQLDLVRLVNQHEIERMELSAFFDEVPTSEKGNAVVQRWKLQNKDNVEDGSEDFAARVRLRPTTKIMEFADYNHDSLASEFYIQTATDPCGKHSGIVVGVTRKNPKLHVFGTALNPDKPLMLHWPAWDALRKAKGTIEVLDWKCGDHGSDIESDLELRTIDGVIAGVRRDYNCTNAGKRGRLISETPF